MIKSNKLREISDMRDETDLSGLKLAIDLKRGVDPDLLMQKLYRFTPLEDSFSCNFNVLIGGTPRVLGIRALLQEWIAFRQLCIKRRVYFDLTKSYGKTASAEGFAEDSVGHRQSNRNHPADRIGGGCCPQPDDCICE